jgi:hypothetical protein
VVPPSLRLVLIPLDRGGDEHRRFCALHRRGGDEPAEFALSTDPAWMSTDPAVVSTAGFALTTVATVVITAGSAVPPIRRW